MAHGRSRAAAVAVSCLLACGCSSSAKPATRQSESPPVATGTTAVQTYLDAVNKLCDALLPKVIAVTNGGSLDMPLAQFLAQLPAHTKLLSDFDKNLALVSVPPQATDQAAAMNAYIRYASELDARRLAAARQGQAGYTKEIQAEQASAATDPTIAARNAAGFHNSCDAR
jgi:hypothetical protein